MSSSSPPSDIISFYKESLADDTTNFVHMRAATQGKEPLQVIRELIEDTADVVHRLNGIFKGNPRLDTLCRAFLQVRTA